MEGTATPTDIADLVRILRLDSADHGPALLIATRRNSVVWANAAALALMATGDREALGETLFRRGPVGQSFADHLARLGRRPVFERLILSGARPPIPVAALCLAVVPTGADPIALVRLTAVAGQPSRSAALDEADPTAATQAGMPLPGGPRRILWETDRAGIITHLEPAGSSAGEGDLLVLGTPVAAQFRDDAPALAERLDGLLHEGGSIGTTRFAWRQPGRAPLMVEVGCAGRPGRSGLRGFLLVSEFDGRTTQPPAEIPPPAAAITEAPGPDVTAPPAFESEHPIATAPVDVEPHASEPPLSASHEMAEEPAAIAGGNVVHFPALRAASPSTPAVRPGTRTAHEAPAAGESGDLEQPLWAESPDDAGQALTEDERDAFAHIAQVLGTRRNPPVAAPDATTISPSAATDAADAIQNLLAVLPVGVLLRRDGRLDANPALLRQTGDGDAEALRARFAGIDPTRSGALTRSDGLALASEMFDLDLGGRPARLLVTARQDAARPAPREDDPPPSREILDAVTTNGFVRFDDAGRIADASAKAVTVLGRGGEGLIGRLLSDVVAFETDPDWSARPSTPRLHRAATRDSEPVPLALEIIPLEAGALGLLSTDRPSEDLQPAAAAALREAERTSALKSEFLAKVSHEIRTPLNAILGFAEVIRDERLGPVGNSRYLEYLADIHAAGTHVLSLVNDLLDLSRIEAGRMDLQLEAVDANAIVQSCVNTLQTQAHRGRIIVRLSLAPHLPSALADARSLRQIVLNLLSNAVKFNEPGGQVIVSTAPVGPDAVAIRIRDTGIGMTDTEIAAALEPFRQLSTVDRTGSGLGLPLTKALVEANCASMAIKSGRGEGTLVEVIFPMVERTDVSLPA